MEHGHELQRQAEDTIDSAGKDPVQAIAQAATLPASLADNVFQSPRGHVLETIAKINVKNHPAVARQAVDELKKMAEDLAPQAQVIYLASAADRVRVESHSGRSAARPAECVSR